VWLGWVIGASGWDFLTWFHHPISSFFFTFFLPFLPFILFIYLFIFYLLTVPPVECAAVSL